MMMMMVMMMMTMLMDTAVIIVGVHCAIVTTSVDWPNLATQLQSHLQHHQDYTLYISPS